MEIFYLENCEFSSVENWKLADFWGEFFSFKSLHECSFKVLKEAKRQLMHSTDWIFPAISIFYPDISRVGRKPPLPLSKTF